MLPKTIYQIWFQGCDRVDKQAYKENMKNWQLLNPTWNYRCLSDADLRQACYAYSRAAGQVYDTFETMHEKIDFGRFVTCYLLGGIYIDMDCYALRSLDHVPALQPFMHQSKMSPSLALSELSLTRLEALVWFGTSTAVNNGILIATPKHPFLKEWIDQLIVKVQNTPRLHIEETTGPKAFNGFVQTRKQAYQQGGQPMLTLLPSHIFEPCRVGGQCELNDATVAIHRYEMSWLTPKMKILANMYGMYRDIVLGIVITLVVTWTTYWLTRL